MTNKGFSLIELLVALSIIALSLSFFAYFSDALSLTSSAKNEAAIAAYSHNYLEKLRSEWQNLDKFKNRSGIDLNDLPKGYSGQINIDEETGKVYNSDKKISEKVVSLRTVEIVLSDQAGNEFKMSTKIARPLE